MGSRNTTRNPFAIATIAAIGTATAIAAVFTPTRATRAQTTATPASPAPPHKHLKLRSRELTPSAGDPYAALPNYAATALTLRHWHQPEILFHVTPDPNDLRTPDQIRALVAQGIGMWKDKIGSKLTLRMVDDAAVADVEISFVPTGTLSGRRIGETDVKFSDPENDIQRASIQLVEKLSSDLIVQSIAHETGHALGIQGHSDDKHDLMYAYAHLPAAISDRDANTMNVAYYQIDTSNKVRDFKRGQKFASVKSY